MVTLTLLVGCVGPEPGLAPSISTSDVPVPTPAPPLLEQESAPTAPAPPAPGDGALTTDELTVDVGSTQQMISGVGVNANVHSWKGGQLKPAIDRYAAMGPLTWRVIVERADWEPSQTGDPESIDWGYYTPIYTSPKLQDLWDTISYIESKPGQTVTLSVMGGVPSWMGGTHILPDKEDYWVRMVSSLVAYARQHLGLKLNLVSPLNEPDLDGIEGPKVDPGQLTRLLDKLGHRLDALGLTDVRFIGPDTSSTDGARTAYLPAILSDPYVVSKIARVGAHTYSGDVSGLPAALGSTPLAAQGVWVTEFNAPCDGCDSGNRPDDSWGRAETMASSLLSLLQGGASGAQLYDAWDGYYEHHGAMGYWGALAYDPTTGEYTPRRVFDAFGFLCAHIAPGAVHVQTAGASALTVVALLNPATGTVTVVGVNGTGSSQRFRIALHSTAALSSAQLEDLSDDGPSASRPQVDGSGLTVSVPADSVFALTVQR